MVVGWLCERQLGELETAEVPWATRSPYPMSADAPGRKDATPSRSPLPSPTESPLETPEETPERTPEPEENEGGEGGEERDRQGGF
jgi:hypothetical protein